MKTTIFNAAIIFGVLAGINLGWAVSLEFHPISFVASIIMIAFGVFSIHHAIDFPQQAGEP
jgi:hypothetical protein